VPLAGASCTRKTGPGSLVISDARTSHAARSGPRCESTPGARPDWRTRCSIAWNGSRSSAAISGIGLDDAKGIGLQQQYRLIRGVEQQAVAGLHLPQFPIFLLHRLLGGDEPGLKFGDREQVAPNGDEAGFAPKPDRRVLHWDFEAAGKPLVHLTVGRNPAFARVLDHAHDLAADSVADGLDPGAASPRVDRFLGNGIRKRYVLNDPVQIEHQGDVWLGDIDARQRRESDSNLLMTPVYHIRMS
jgi:hypothetical protein